MAVFEGDALPQLGKRPTVAGMEVSAKHAAQMQHTVFVGIKVRVTHKDIPRLGRVLFLLRVLQARDKRDAKRRKKRKDEREKAKKAKEQEQAEAMASETEEQVCMSTMNAL